MAITRIFPFVFLTALAGCLVAEDLTRAGNAGSVPTTAESVAALRQALEQGSRQAVGTLGRKDGFYANNRVRIPLPTELQKAEQLLRKLGQGQYADRFLLSLNRAAEQAVPEAAGILADILGRMTIRDAVSIIRGPENAATEYFRHHGEAALVSRFKPVVGSATASVGVTKAYKDLLGRAGFAEQLLSPEARDLDAYVTTRAVDALFLYIAEEERKLRRDPLSRGTELLRKVFGYYLD
jgi:hypothetical protein